MKILRDLWKCETRECRRGLELQAGQSEGACAEEQIQGPQFRIACERIEEEVCLRRK